MLFSEDCFFGFTSGLGCCLVVATVQATADKTAVFYLLLKQAKQGSTDKATI
jgi:hypothetical protein